METCNHPGKNIGTPTGRGYSKHAIETGARCSPDTIAAFRKKLRQWYKKNRRPLPWRLDPSPYRVWISEIMLQQTQAKTVIPYYNRFLKCFPDIPSLSRSSEEEILTLWSGLGYYSRARNLHRAARHIAENHNGIFPTDYKTIRSLPGIGRYTAGAICSIAFNQPHPIVDGNIRRVIARLKGIRKHIPEKYYWNQMTRLVPEKEPAIFNQAMMELGATICTPAHPLCSGCPVRNLCRARKTGAQNDIPIPGIRHAVNKMELVVLILRHEEKILLVLQEKSFIPGRWGLPYELMQKKQSPVEAVASLNRRLFNVGISIDYLTAFRHSITNRRLLAHIFTGDARKEVMQSDAEANDAFWATKAQQNSMLTSSLFRKALHDYYKRIKNY